MSKAASPTRFAGESDHFYDPNFTAEISQKMRVPKRIKVDGDTNDEVVASIPPNSWHHNNDKFDMQVPDRILVLGHEQHFGTRAPPRELVLENTVMPPDPGVVRVQTPPRVLKLDEHYFPTADDCTPPPIERNDFTIVRPKPRRDLDLDNDSRLDVSSATLREVTPGLSEGMTTSEEVVHLRRQLAKLNRRVMSIELGNLHRQQREKIMYAVGLAYFLFKALIWLNRSS